MDVHEAARGFFALKRARSTVEKEEDLHATSLAPNGPSGSMKDIFLAQRGGIRRRDPKGFVRGGPAHIAYMNKIREKFALQRTMGSERQGMASVTSAFSFERLRVGDQALMPGADERDYGLMVHPNQYVPRSILMLAWQQIGKNKNPRAGIDAQRYDLAILASVASASLQHQSDLLHDVMTKEVVNSGRCPAILRFYDATPTRLAFGRYEDVLRPVARYAVLRGKGRTLRWRIVNIDQYKKWFPRHHVRKGILEVLAQGAIVQGDGPGFIILSFWLSSSWRCMHHGLDGS